MPTNQDGQGPDAGTQPTPPAPTPDVGASFQRLLDRSDDAVALARQLFEERYQDREQRRQLQAQLDALAPKVPTAGQVVLSAEEAQLLEAYRGLGEVEGLRTLQTQAATAQRELSVRKAAEAVKWNVAALNKLAPEGTALTVEEGVAYLVEGADRHPLTEYAQTHWPEFLVALQNGQGASGGTPYPAQSGGARPPAKTNASVAKGILSRAYSTSKE